MGVKLQFAAAILGATVFVTAAPASPYGYTFPYLTIGPGTDAQTSFSSLDWQINDAGPSPRFPSAPGVAGPMDDANNNVSGWTELESLHEIFGEGLAPGNLSWTASSAPGRQFQMVLETLLGPESAAGQSPDGPMADFDLTRKYVWPIISWEGAYTGPSDDPTLNAATVINTDSFANAYDGSFALHFNGANTIDLVYSPVPEPGTLSLVAVGLVAVWRRRRRRH